MKKQAASANRSPLMDDSDDPLINTRMRVWWAPTDDKAKTGFAGAYWPVNVLGKRCLGTYWVEYDNGEREDVLLDNIAPYDLPVDFGEEEIPLEAGEFCEVSNNSTTDPCCWVAMVSKRLSNGHYMVTYPFHDSDDECVPPHLIRRARVIEELGWYLLRPKQHWKDGEVLSPHELESIREEDLGKYVKLTKPTQAKPKPQVKATDSKGKRSANTAAKTPERPQQRARV